MPYTVTFLNQKLYQSLSFDADIKFPYSSDYTKKIWILKEYKKAGEELSLDESDVKPFKGGRSSWEISKSFKGDELVVELIQNVSFFDDFDFFSKAELEEETGDSELDKILSSIKESDFDESTIKALILDESEDSEDLLQSLTELFGLDKQVKLADFKEDFVGHDPKEKCSPDCDCDCE